MSFSKFKTLSNEAIRGIFQDPSRAELLPKKLGQQKYKDGARPFNKNTVSEPQAPPGGFKTLVSLLGIKKFESKKISAIYFLLSNEKLVYIGKTTDIDDRIRAHKSGKMLFDSIYYVECGPHLLDNIEATFIVAFKPKYNTAISKSKAWPISMAYECLGIKIPYSSKDPMAQLYINVLNNKHQVIGHTKTEQYNNSRESIDETTGHN